MIVDEVPITGVTALATAPASAATSFITCKALTGTVNTTTGAVHVTYSKCSGHTGTKGKSTTTATSTRATVHWANGKATTFTTKTAAGKFTCPTGTTAERTTGKVTKDTTGSATVGGAVSADICYNLTTGHLALKSGTVDKI